MDDDRSQIRSAVHRTLGRARESLREAGSAAIRHLRRTRERVGGTLGSAADRMKDSNTGERLNAALETRRVIKRAEAAHARGNAPMAFRLLEEEIRAKPTDEKLAIAFWRTCVALDRGAEGADGLLRVIRRRSTEGDLEEAASLWTELVDLVPESRVDAGSLIRIAPVLQEIAPERAVQALRTALDPQTPGLTAGLAMRALDIGREFDPPSCLRAARMALEWPDLAETKRAKLEQLIDEFESEAVPAPTVLRQPAPSPAPAVAVDRDFAELVVEETVEAFAPATRFSGIKIVDAAPSALADGSIEFSMSDGRAARLDYTSIQAIAAGEIAGLAAEPIVLIDLALNWHEQDEEILRVVRLRTDRFEAPAFAGCDPQVLRSLLDQLLSRSEALPLMDPEVTVGQPFQYYGDLDSYQREVLQVG